MSANELLNPAEDADMTDGSDEKVVTMLDVLQEQKEFEEDANAVLGASDEKNCTFPKGYIKRQAIYACITCCGDAKDDNTKRAGVCLACSLNCHENHELVELYTKRNFRCDCGNQKFNSHPCQFVPDKTELNEENDYNQNFSGLYCTCHRPYPDPDSTFEDEMIQCIVCEDWLHASHLEATVPANEQYAEMVCKGCMEKNEFLHDYSEFAVNNEDQEIDILPVDAPNNASNELNTCTNEALPNGTNSNHKDDENIEDANMSDKNESKDVSMDVDAIEHLSNVETADTQNGNSDIDINEEDEAKENSPGESEVKQPLNDDQGTMVSTENDNTKEEKLQTNTSATDDVDKKLNEETNAPPSNLESETLETNDNTENMKSTVISDTQETVENAKSPEKNENNLSSETIENGDQSTQKLLETSQIEKLLDSESANTETATNTNDEPTETAQHLETTENSDIVTENRSVDTSIISENEETLKDSVANSTGDTKIADTDEKKDEVLEPTSNSQESHESSLCIDKDSNIESKNDQTGEEIESELEQSKIHEKANSPSDVDMTSETRSYEDKGDEEAESKLEESELQNGEANSETDVNMTSEIKSCENMSTCENRVASNEDKDDESKLEERELQNGEADSQTDVDMASEINSCGNTSTSNENKADDINNSTTEVNITGQENKRKLSTEDSEEVAAKKVKVDVQACIRPKGIKKRFKGATFWPSDFRQKLCTCNECISMYKDLSVLFLIDPEDTVTAYEALGQERTNGAAASQYEKGLEALSSLDRTQQINALTEYNKMKDKLLDFLKSFKDRKEIVKEEDIKQFFAGMKLKREPDGVYFCR